jgi:hypothetical protein
MADGKRKSRPGRGRYRMRPFRCWTKCNSRGAVRRANTARTLLDGLGFSYLPSPVGAFLGLAALVDGDESTTSCFSFYLFSLKMSYKKEVCAYRAMEVVFLSSLLLLFFFAKEGEFASLVLLSPEICDIYPPYMCKHLYTLNHEKSSRNISKNVCEFRG